MTDYSQPHLTKNLQKMFNLDKIINDYIGNKPIIRRKNPKNICNFNFIREKQLNVSKSVRKSLSNLRIATSSKLSGESRNQENNSTKNQEKSTIKLTKFNSMQASTKQYHIDFKLNNNPSYIEIRQKLTNKYKIKNRYEILEILSKRNESIVYKVNDTLTNRILAIKVLTQRQPIQLEILKQLDHPNLIKNINVFTFQNKIHIVFQYYQRSLNSYLKQVKHNINKIKQVFKGICKGVEYLHRFGIIHRNIKINNVMIEQKSATFFNPVQIIPKLIDFGLAIKLDQQQNKNKLFSFKDFCGTPQYIAPEIIEKQLYEGKSVDCWALGIMLYYMLIGRVPFKAKQESQLYRKIKRGKIYFPPDLPEGGKKLILSLLKRSPNERSTVSQVLADPWLL